MSQSVSLNHWQPFYNLSDFEFTNFIQYNLKNHEYNSVDSLNEIVFNQFYSDFDKFDSNLNPDLIFFMNSNIINNECQYYFDDTVKESLDKLDINDQIFSLLSININSIPKNLDYFINSCLNVVDFNFDVISFCETKLTDHIDQLYEIHNYNKFTNNNTRNSGGVALFVKKCYVNVLIRNDLKRNFDFLESLFVEIKCQEGSNIVIGSIYRRPNSNLNNFLQEIEYIINLLNREDKKYIC